MMMDKYGRSPYRRTTSMTGITVVGLDYTTEMAAPPPPPPPPGVGAGEYEHMYNMLSPRYNSSYVVETADFLRSCGLCNCRLAPGRDIYMYRGDAAFCSLECREHQMNLDERQERREAAAAKKGNNRLGEGVAVAPKATAKSGATATA